jgi:hypothetical protein
MTWERDGPNIPVSPILAVSTILFTGWPIVISPCIAARLLAIVAMIGKLLG